jgi:dTDP-4-dehydrorhamnose 3,5-epimerase
MIIITETNLDGVLLIHTGAFEDHRGHYVETYNENEYRQHGITTKFVQDSISVSSQNVLRGIHGDDTTWKLISCLYGRFYAVVVNCDTESKSFGEWYNHTLSDTNRAQLLVPPKYGIGHLILSEKAIFHYKQSTNYTPEKQFTFRFDDPRFNIYWPCKNPILSNRDRSAPTI